MYKQAQKMTLIMLKTTSWEKVLKEEPTTKGKHVKIIKASHSKPIENITINLE